jgi:hypothetical protein
MSRREKLYIFFNILLVFVVIKYFLYINKSWYVNTDGLVPSLTITFLAAIALLLNLLNFCYRNCCKDKEKHDAQNRDAENQDSQGIDC